MTFGTHVHADHRLLSLICDQVRGLPGCAVEFGVYQGCSLALLCDALTPARVYGLDTFQGLPEPGPFDLNLRGQFRDTDIERVAARLAPRSNYTLVPGLFRDTLPTLPVDRVLLAHLDCDYHDGYHQALEWTWPRLVPGGRIVCDDYQASMCPGARRAVDEWLSSHGGHQHEVTNGRCVIQKTGGKNGS
jgi:O-methyltransferase